MDIFIFAIVSSNAYQISSKSLHFCNFGSLTTDFNWTKLHQKAL